MKKMILVLLFFTVIFSVLDFSRAYANNQFISLASTDTCTYYIDASTLTNMKDDNNRVFYDSWVIAENKQEIPELNIRKNQNEPSQRTIFHIVYVLTAEKKMAQLLSRASYTKNDEIINSYTPVEPKIYDISNDTLIGILFYGIDDYISKKQITPIAVPNEKYLPITKKDFFNLFESRGYKLNKIEEVQQHNPFDGSDYTAFTSLYSFLDKVIEKEVHINVAGKDSQHLKSADIQFALEYPNYEQATKKFNLPYEEKMNLFYMMLQVLFPDWPKEESKKWIDNSISTMNQQNTLVFKYLHKGKEYIMLSRQPVQGNQVVVYVLTVSQNQPPSGVNPFHPYNEDGNSICIYEEWNTLQKN